jgi:hypothetical protein
MEETSIHIDGLIDCRWCRIGEWNRPLKFFILTARDFVFKLFKYLFNDAFGY